MRFDDIIRYYNACGELPNGIDGSAQFAFFKYYPFDLTYLFLQDNPQAYAYQRVSKTLEETVQYIPYSELDLPRLLPFVYKYFTPSAYIKSIKKYYEQKYGLDYSNTCAIFYRGVEKSVEIPMGSYAEYIGKAREVLKDNPNIRFLVQSDEIEFVDEFLREIPNSFSIEETFKVNRANYTTAIPFLMPQIVRQYAISLFFAATLCVANCKHLITHSGNCGLWAILYRGNMENVYQYLEGKWV